MTYPSRQEPWNPIGNPDLDRTINLFCGTTRESNHGTTLYEGWFNGEWNAVEQRIDESFQYIEGWEDGPYRVVWLSEKLLAQVTYCEGDLYLDVAQDAERYKRIVESAMQFYTIDKDHWVGIPQSMEMTQAIIDAMSQDWKQTKLKAEGQTIIARGFSSEELWEAAQHWFEENPEGALKLDAGGGALWLGKKAFEQIGARAEFDRYFLPAKN